MADISNEFEVEDFDEECAPTADDFPEPYVEPPEQLIERPLQPAVPKQEPLFVSPSRVGLASVRMPSSGLMVPNVAPAFPRPKPPGTEQRGEQEVVTSRAPVAEQILSVPIPSKPARPLLLRAPWERPPSAPTTKVAFQMQAPLKVTK